MVLLISCQTARAIMGMQLIGRTTPGAAGAVSQRVRHIAQGDECIQGQETILMTTAELTTVCTLFLYTQLLWIFIQR